MVIDMLDSRKKEDVVEWLKPYVNLGIITRNRASSYGYAIKEVNEKIVQIADSFHIYANITEKGIYFIRKEFPNEYELNDEVKIKRTTIENLMYKNSEKEWDKNIKKCLKIFPKIKQFLLQIYKYKNITKNCDIKGFKKLIKNWEENSISVLKTLIKGIKNDFDAVLNSVKYKLTNGLAEGTVNKIKVIKRFCYGRAKGELLKKRVLLYDEFHHRE